MVLISNVQSIPLGEELVRQAAEVTLAAEGENDSELSVHLTDDVEIHELNRQYRQTDRPTDVLAFAMREGSDSALHPSLLGDVVISVETAQRQAAEGCFKQELALLTIHGVLHLLGYDHELPEDAAVMFEKQSRILLSLSW